MRRACIGVIAGVCLVAGAIWSNLVFEHQSVTAASPAAAWLTYHRDNARSGNDTTEPSASGVSNLWTAHTATQSTTLDGGLYATPLVLNSSVYVATENDTVYAFNTADGSEQWHVHFATPEAASNLPCGNISPNVGVTGTPVIDPNADGGNGVIFMAAMTYEPHYRLYGVDLVTHAVVFNSVIDTGDVLIEGQRGALALASGNVYVPFGGRAGDCYDGSTPYYGIVESIPTNGAAHVSWRAANTDAAGIWAPGGESVDAAGNVYVATGNGSGPGTESVFKLSPTLGQLAQWRASNWQFLDNNDIDIGSIIPSLIGGGNVFQNGKFGHGFILNSGLGQLTGDPGATTCGGLTSDASFGATAYAAPYIYVPCANGLFAFNETTFTASSTPTWHALSSFSGAPIVAGGLVWALSSGNLYGFNPTTGATVTSIGVGSFSRFQSPVTAGGKLFVAGSNYLKAFSMGSGCSTANVTATPTGSQQAGLAVSLNATSSGPGCTTPIYEFWVQYPDQTWHLGRSFSTLATWSWDTTGRKPGAYVIHVWANEQGDPTATYEALGSLNYTLTACATASINPPAPTQVVATTVALTASSTGCPSPAYEYWINFGTAWYPWRPFSTDPAWNLDTTGFSPGTYIVHVWANGAGADTSAYQAVGSTTITLTGCTSASLSPPSGSVPAGTSVMFTASSSGCPSPDYEFWIQDTQGYWHQMTNFGGPTWTWVNTGWGRGTYHIHVWANEHGAYTGRLEVIGVSTITLT